MDERRETSPNSSGCAETPGFRFERLETYRLAKELAVDIIRITRDFPKEASFSLGPQLQRAALSIASTIAEGSGRLHSADQVHFTSIAYSSLMEVVCQLDVAGELGWISKETMADSRFRAEALARKLSALHGAQMHPSVCRP